MEGGRNRKNELSEGWPRLQTSSYDTVTDVQDLFVPIASSTFKVVENETKPLLYFKSNFSSPSTESDLFDESKWKEAEYQQSNKYNNNTPENWRLRVTIPEPFHMTLRDTPNKNDKSKPCKRWMREMEKQKQNEVPEWYKKFRANAVPPTTYFPIYSDMLKREETRRQTRKEKCREHTLAMQKPFNFYFREEVKKLFRSKSEPNLMRDGNESKSFKATPAPSRRHRRHYSMNEEDRKQGECLQTKDATPRPKMKYFSDANEKDMSLKNVRSKLQAAREWNSIMKWSLNQPQIAKRIFDPPDFNAIHADLAKKQKNQLPSKVTTSCEPFTLHLASLSNRLEKVREDMRRDELNLKETRWPFVAARTLVHPTANDITVAKQNQLPPRLNLAAKLRAENNCKQMLTRCDDERQTPSWKQELRRCLSAKMATENNYENPEEKLRRKRAEIKSQLLGYQSELDDMMKRVASRPLLMEQQTTMAARKRAERIFAEKLQQYGLTEELVLAKSHLHSGIARQRDNSISSESSSKTLKRSRSASSTSRNISSASVSRATQTKKESMQENYLSGQENVPNNSSSDDTAESLFSSKNSGEDELSQ